MIHIGFTGTQQGMNHIQLKTLNYFLGGIYHHHFTEVTFHYGQCIGADAEAAQLARNMGFKLKSHPPIITSKMSLLPIADEIAVAKDFLVRNRDIVDESALLIAAPHTNLEEIRSGTWATVRYARRLKKPIMYCMPG